MKKCKCGAMWRINYPFGKNSKRRIAYLIKHTEKCISLRRSNKERALRNFRRKEDVKKRK